MTAWEYAFLYEVPTVTISEPAEAAPMIYLIEDAAGLHIVEDADAKITAFNALGRDGWLIQFPALWRSSDKHELINETLGKALSLRVYDQGWVWSMRRTRTSGSPLSS